MPKWKNRPGGKKGWRTIVEEPKVIQKTPLSRQYHLKNTSRQRDQDLFYVDTVGTKEQTKSDIRFNARAELEATGHLPRTDKGAKKLAKLRAKHMKKQSRKLTPKKVQPRSKNSKEKETMRKKRERENRFGQTHCFDPWADEPITKKRRKVTKKKEDCDENDESADVADSTSEVSNHDKPMADVFGGRFADDTPSELIESMKRSYGVIKVSRPAVKNRLVPKSISIRRPTHGESVNPLPSNMIQVGLNRQKILQKQRFAKKWGSQSTKKWFEDRVHETEEEKPNHEMTRLLVVKKANQRFNKKWEAILKLQRKKKNQLKKGDDRFTSDLLLRRTKMRRIYGKSRVNPLVPAKSISLQKVGRPFRISVDSTGGPVSNMFDELRAQNRTEGKKRAGFTYRRKAFFGPRYKVQTRVGGVHHRNVGSRIFRDFEDLQY